LPVEISLSIGDIAHNTRAALDHLAYALARNPGMDTVFPIWKEPRVDKSTGKRLQPFIAGGVRREVKQILRAVQPYNSRQRAPEDHTLFKLRELDNVDKHRYLVTSVCSDWGYHRKLVQWVGDVEIISQPSRLEPGDEIARFIFTEPNPGLEFDYQPSPRISVREVIPALDEAEIVGELHDMIAYVRNILRACGPYLRC
jgi:hypothetical protein